MGYMDYVMCSHDLKKYKNKNLEIIYRYSFDGVFQESYYLQLSALIQDIKKNKTYYHLVIIEDSSNWYISSVYHPNELVLPKYGKFNILFTINDNLNDDFLKESLNKLKSIPGFSIKEYYLTILNT